MFCDDCKVKDLCKYKLKADTLQAAVDSHMERSGFGKDNIMTVNYFCRLKVLESSDFRTRSTV